MVLVLRLVSSADSIILVLEEYKDLKASTALFSKYVTSFIASSSMVRSIFENTNGNLEDKKTIYIYIYIYIRI